MNNLEFYVYQIHRSRGSKLIAAFWGKQEALDFMGRIHADTVGRMDNEVCYITIGQWEVYGSEWGGEPARASDGITAG